MIEGNINLKQEITSNELYKIKIEHENLNREFELVKVNNIIIHEEIINEQVEKKNYLNDILKINLDKEIMKDAKVRNCDTFIKLIEKQKRMTKRSQFNTFNVINPSDHKEFNIYTFMKLDLDSDKKNDIRRSSIIRSTVKSERQLINSSSSSDEDDLAECDEDFDYFANIEEKLNEKIKKVMVIKNDYILGKLRNKQNPLFNAYLSFCDNFKDSI
jgi:hypothetical protein